MANLIVESLYEKYGAMAPGVKTHKRKALVEHIDLSDKLGNIVRPGGMRDESKICDIVASHVAYEEMFREIGYDDDCSLIFYLNDADAMNIQSIVDDINDEFSAKDMPNYAQVCSYTNSPAIEVQELFRSINAYVENTPLTNDSLTEAINHENDEINEIIRRNLGKKPNRISKADMKALNDAGINVIDDVTMKGPNGRTIQRYGRTDTYGPMHTVGRRKTRWGNYPGRQIADWDISARAFNAGDPANQGVENFSKVDLKGYLDKPEREHPQRREDEIQKKLRPYSDEYKDLKSNERFSKNMSDTYAKEIRSEEDIDAEVNRLRDKLNRDNEFKIERKKDYDDAAEDARKGIEDIKAKANANRDARKTKTESLSLKEDIESAIPSFNDAFRKALKDVIWRDVTESEADKFVSGIVDATNLLLTDLLETITKLDERITELENK